MDTNSAIEDSTRWLSMQLREIDRDPHPHDLAAVAQPFLSPARKSSEAVIEAVSVYTEQLKWALFLTGSRNLIDLKKVKVYEK